MKHDQLYSVPDDYFEELPQKIQKRLSKKNKTAKVWIFALRYALPLVVVGLFGISFYVLRSTPEPQITASEAAIAEYLWENGVSEAELVSLTNEEDLDTFLEQAWEQTEQEIDENNLDLDW